MIERAYPHFAPPVLATPRAFPYHRVESRTFVISVTLPTYSVAQCRKQPLAGGGGRSRHLNSPPAAAQRPHAPIPLAAQRQAFAGATSLPRLRRARAAGAGLA